MVNIVIILYCLLALINYAGIWFINDMTYGLRLIVLALPLYLKMDSLDNISKILLGFLLFSNLVTILGDYQFIDIYDDAIYYPKLITIIVLLIYSIKRLK